MPIADVTLGYINMLMLLFEAPHRLYIYDDLNNNAEPLQRWADAGKLNRQIPFYVAAIVKPRFPFFPSLASFLEESGFIVLNIHTYALSCSGAQVWQCA